MWLLKKLYDQKKQSTLRFAFQGTVNWMRALAIILENDYSHESLNQFYKTVKRRSANEQADLLAFECLTMSLHHASAISALGTIENPYAISRLAIISWYYAVYYASKSMLAAASGADPQTHSLTGKMWQFEIIKNQLVRDPFCLSITGLTPKSIDVSIKSLRNGNAHDLDNEPTDRDMALGCVYSYLKGTAHHAKEHLEQRIKESSEFKERGFADFRKKEAKALRDAKLGPAHVNFLVQAFRFRGKANYRDAVYLSYGRESSERLHQFVSDLDAVSRSFSSMAAHYVARRVNSGDWASFIDDLENQSNFEIPFQLKEIDSLE